MTQDTVPVPVQPASEPAPAKTSALAIWSLVLGFLSFCMVCVTGIPGLILGIMGLVKIGKAPAELKGKALAIVGIVLSSLGILGTPIVAAILVPALAHTSERANLVRSQANLQMIQTSIELYSFENEGNIPPDLMTLVEAEGILEDLLRSPMAPEGEPLPHYELLLSGKLTSHQPSDVFIRDKFTTGMPGKRKQCVIMADGRGIILREEGGDQILE